jgi:hypothetical protein
MHGRMSLLGSLATIAIIMTDRGPVLGFMKSADVPERLGAILGIAIVLKQIPTVLVDAWVGMLLW